MSKGVAASAIFGYSYNNGVVVIGLWYVKHVPTFYNEPIVLIALGLLIANVSTLIASSFYAKVSVMASIGCMSDWPNVY